MAHKIFGERFMSRTRPAWHKLGIIFPEDEIIIPSEAAKRVSGDLVFARQPLYYDLPGEKGKKNDSENFAIIRLPTKEDPHPMVLGITSERWHLTPYHEMASALDKMDTSIFKVETAGLLSGGSLLFIALRGEDWSVLGKDAMQTYFLLNLSLTPGIGHRVLHTNVRVVCNNTNEAALASSQIQLRIPHGADAKQQIGLAGDLVQRFRNAQEETKRIFDVFASTPAPAETVNAIHAAAWPEPRLPAKLRMLKNVVGQEGIEVFKRGLDPVLFTSLTTAQEAHDRALERCKEVREAGIERFESFEPQELRGTVWAAYNAVTEVADWRGDGNGKLAESSLIGTRAAEKTRAFSAAMNACDVIPA